MTDFGIAFLGIVFTLVGGLVGALATTYAARLTAQKQQQYVESGKFRASFVSELADLRSANGDVYKILHADAIKQHRIAKVYFEAWVPKCSLREFQEAWDEYEKNTVTTTSPGNLGKRSEECLTASVKLEKLLSFAMTRG